MKNKLSEFQESVLVGCLLGDGYMETTTNGRTWRLGIEQKQEFYVSKKYEIFKDLSNKMEEPRAKGSKYAFWTLRLDCLKIYGDAFYPLNSEGKRVKVSPLQLETWLTDCALAFWYMDDGSIKSKDHKLVYLNTQGYSHKDNKFLADLLRRKLKLKTNIKSYTDKRYEGSLYYQISIHGSSLENLPKLIERHMYPEIKQLPPPAKLKE